MRELFGFLIEFLVALLIEIHFREAFLFLLADLEFPEELREASFP